MVLRRCKYSTLEWEHNGSLKDDVASRFFVLWLGRTALFASSLLCVLYAASQKGICMTKVINGSTGWSKELT